MSLDYLNNKDSKFKAFGGFIFGGSASLGVMKSGYDVDRILEMTDDMLELNAYHFNKNFTNAPIVLPEEWENDDYLKQLKEKNYDFAYFNCPCSSLSQLNRNASLDGARNIHFYRVYNMIDKAEPKSFLIENAPTLVKLGYPLLKDMYAQLGEKYNFTVIRDYAGNHNVPMKRMRTLVLGWRKDVFDNKTPLLHMNKKPQVNVKDTIGDLYDIPVNSDKIKNHNIFYEEKRWSEVEHLFNHVSLKSSSLLSFIEHWDTLDSQVESKYIRGEVLRAKQKLENNQRLWDKTPWRVSETCLFPSMTSVTRIIHPKFDRTLTIREYARIMGYPDDFEFFDECKTNIITALCQGVPVNFIEYIATEAMEALKGNRELEEDANVLFQHHTHGVWAKYTFEEANMLTELDHKPSKNSVFQKLTK